MGEEFFDRLEAQVNVRLLSHVRVFDELVPDGLIICLEQFDVHLDSVLFKVSLALWGVVFGRNLRAFKLTHDNLEIIQLCVIEVEIVSKAKLHLTWFFHDWCRSKMITSYSVWHRKAQHQYQGINHEHGLDVKFDLAAPDFIQFNGSNSVQIDFHLILKIK